MKNFQFTCLTPVTTITNNRGSILVTGDVGGSGRQNYDN